MQRKLTISIDEKVYEALHKVIGKGSISQFIEHLVRPHVIDKELESAYKQMAEDESRETEVYEWSEATIGDVSDEPR